MTAHPSHPGPPSAGGLEVRGRGEVLSWAKPGNDIVRIFRQIALETLCRCVPGYESRPPWLDAFLERSGVSPGQWQEAGIRFEDFLNAIHDAPDELRVAEAAARTVGGADPAALTALYAILGQVTLVATLQAAREFPSVGGIYQPRARVEPTTLVSSAIAEDGTPVGLTPSREQP